MSEPFDMGALMAQAQAMQERLLAAQAAAAEQEVEGQAGGGAVRVRVTGGLEFRSVTIDPRAVDPDDVAMLEDLVVAACNDAADRARELSRDAMGGLGLDASGLLGGDAAPGS